LSAAQLPFAMVRPRPIRCNMEGLPEQHVLPA